MNYDLSNCATCDPALKDASSNYFASLEPMMQGLLIFCKALDDHIQLGKRMGSDELNRRIATLSNSYKTAHPHLFMSMPTD